MTSLGFGFLNSNRWRCLHRDCQLAVSPFLAVGRTAPGVPTRSTQHLTADVAKAPTVQPESRRPRWRSSTY